MSKKKRAIQLAIWLILISVFLVYALVTCSQTGKQETIQQVIREAVLHETDKIDILGLQVNPGVVSAFTVTVIILLLAGCIRIFAIPRFRMVPGKFQLLLEQLVGFFDRLAKSNSPHRNGFLGAYIFGAGVFFLFGGLF